MTVSAICTPELEEITELVHDLLGLDVTAAAVCPDGEYSVAAYQDETGETVAYVTCDLATGCRLGAALTQVPAGRVEEAVSSGLMPANLIENLDEIFNISVNLIANPEKGRIVFAGATHGAPTEEVKQHIQEMTSTEFCFEVERYGCCRLVMVS